MHLRRIEVLTPCGWCGPNWLVSWAGIAEAGLSHHRRKQRKIARSGGKFWWTPAGWRRFGAELLARCKSRGLTVRLLARDHRGKTIFRDEFQVVVPRADDHK